MFSTRELYGSLSFMQINSLYFAWFLDQFCYPFRYAYFFPFFPLGSRESYHSSPPSLCDRSHRNGRKDHYLSICESLSRANFFRKRCHELSIPLQWRIRTSSDDHRSKNSWEKSTVMDFPYFRHSLSSRATISSISRPRIRYRPSWWDDVSHRYCCTRYCYPLCRRTQPPRTVWNPWEI